MNVISPDDMDDETFGLHMTHRHGESLGGLEELKLRNGGDLAVMWRSFHRRLHALRVDLGHDHEDYSPVTDSAEVRPLRPASRIKAAS